MDERELFLKILGSTLRKMREAKGISLRELELHTDKLDRQVMSKMEQGKRSGTIYSYQKYCEALGIKLSKVLTGVEKELES